MTRKKNQSKQRTYNSEQQNILNSKASAIGILGGPGTGKTVILSQILANLTPKNKTSNILGFTSSPKFSKIIQKDLANLGQPSKTFNIHPIRLFCLQLLENHDPHFKKHTPTIISECDQKTIIKDLLKAHNITENPRVILECIQHTKRYSPGIDIMFNFMSPNVSYIMEKYEKYMNAHHLIDSDDITYMALAVLRNDPQIAEAYKNYTLFLENAEDATIAQLSLFLILSKSAKNIIITADPSQALLSYDNKFTEFLVTLMPKLEIFHLTQNFQCSGAIVEALNNTSINNSTTSTQNKPGQPITSFRAYDEMEELRYIVQKIESKREELNYEYSDFIIVYKRPSQLRLIEKAFKAEKLPYRFACNLKRNYMSKLKLIVYMIRYSQNQCDLPAKSVLQQSGVNIKSIPNLKANQDFKQAIDDIEANNLFMSKQGIKSLFAYLRNLQFSGTIKEFLTLTSLYALPQHDSNSVRIVSVEEAKGFVEKCVFICGMEDGIFPHVDAHLCETAFKKERQLFYSAIACARESIYLTSASRRRVLNREWQNDESEFLKSIKQLAQFRSELLATGLKKHADESYQYVSLKNKSKPVSSIKLEEGYSFNHPLFGRGTIKSFTGEFQNRIAQVLFGLKQRQISESFIISQMSK